MWRSPFNLLAGAAIVCFVSDAAAVTTGYTEDFELEATCSTSCSVACPLMGQFVNSLLDDRDWRVNTGTTSSTLTGPPADHTLGTSIGKYLYIETSSPCEAGFDADLISPDLTLTGTTSPAARFWYHMYGTNIGTLHVDVLDTNDNLVTANVFTRSNDQGNMWVQTPFIDLTSYIGMGAVRLRISGDHLGPSFNGDIAIDDFRFLDPSSVDIGVVSVDSLVDGCNLSAETITVTIENFSGVPQTNFDIELSVNGGTPITETVTATLPAFGSIPYTFAATADLSMSGLNDVDVRTLAVGDVNVNNDGTTHTVYNGGSLVGPFAEDFEGPDAAISWFTGGTNSDWALGAPTDTSINSANSGTNAWVTNLTFNNAVNQQSYVQTLCGVDLSAMTTPGLQLAVNYDVDDSDGAAVQYSIDDGMNWVTIGGVGTGLNWYNAAAIPGMPGGQGLGWTGDDFDSSNGWQIALHDIAALAGESNVLFRVVFGSDVSFTDEGFAFDDFEIFENGTSSVDVDIAPGSAPPQHGAFPPSYPDLVSLTVDMTAFGPTAQTLDQIVVTNTGTIDDADIAWELWRDDGDGLFNRGLDTVVSGTAQVGGIATLDAASTVLSPLSHSRFFVVASLDSAATPGTTFSASIENPGTDISFEGGSNILVGSHVNGHTYDVGQLVSALPFTDDFSAIHPALLDLPGEGSYPGAVGTFGGITHTGFSTESRIQFLPGFNGLTPTSGTLMAAIDFPNGTAAGAIQYAFDLSAYSVQTDNLWLAVRYTDYIESSSDQDGILASLDGGRSWFGLFHDLNPSQMTDLQWRQTVVDLSKTLDTLNGDFTNNFVLRLQSSGVSSSSSALFDQIFVGEAPQLAIERPQLTAVPDGSTDALGTVSASPQTYTYTIRNDGDFTLQMTSFDVLNTQNVLSQLVTPPSPTQIAPGTTGTFELMFEPDVGPFNFDLEVGAIAPGYENAKYTIHIEGIADPPLAEIDVQRPVGMGVPSDTNDQVGAVVAGEQLQLTYTIENTGFIDLVLNQLTITEQDNVAAGFINVPNTNLAPGDVTELTIGYTVISIGMFAFDVVIDNNDPDENPYTITVRGEATEGGIGVGGAGGMGGSDVVGAGGMGAQGGAPMMMEDDGETDPPSEDPGCGCSVPGKRSVPGNQERDTRWLWWTALGALMTVRRARKRRTER